MYKRQIEFRLPESTARFQEVFVEAPELEVVLGGHGAGVVREVEGPMPIQVQNGLEIPAAPVEVEDGDGGDVGAAGDRGRGVAVVVVVVVVAVTGAGFVTVGAGSHSLPELIFTGLSFWENEIG